jgi:hypothetical protein
MLLLKQNTACTVKIGPFLDNGDGYTAETGLTVSQADVRLSKNGGNIAQKSNSTSCTHDELGWYDCPLNSTDTNTLGRLQLMVAESGALPVFHEFMVVTANVYDSLCGSDTLYTYVTNKSGYSLSDAGVDAIWDELSSGHTTAGSFGLTLANLLRIGKNKWGYSGTTFTIYADNGTDALYQFTLDSAVTPTTRTPV